MNNAQFRDLISNEKTKAPRQDGAASAFVPRSLGSRARSAKPMTPRVIGVSYKGHSAEHLAAERSRQHDGEPAQKKIKSSAAPKGTKLAPGYQDRTKLREDGYNEETSKEKKLKSLEKMLKDEKIDQATFERLRDQMGIGGDLSTTHLVKGLDFKLLEKTRRGEDFEDVSSQDKSEPNVDLDDELDNVLEKNVTALPSVKDNSGEEPAPTPTAAPAEILSREEMVRRLKESRRGQSSGNPTPKHALGEKFKKLAAAEKPGKKKFVEIVNGRRREVLLLTQKDGSTKRKTRWLDPEGAASNENAAPLGMEVPVELAAKQKALLEQETAAEEDDDIFVGAAEYDPLKDLDDSESEGEGNKNTTAAKAKSEIQNADVDSKPRNYFAATGEAGEEESRLPSAKDDGHLIMAIKRAAALRQLEEGAERPAPEDAADASQEDRHKDFLARLKQQDRQDAEDLDLGFGESRFGDDDDEDGPLYDGEEQGGRKSRKRGPKKRKGDKDNVADVMRAIEGQRK
ncbi:hypothetical protein DV738_g1345, partial [Chaetothyriales sp. CBS 135597]